MKVLIADDSNVTRKMIASYLAGLGVTNVDHAQDGAEALTKGKNGEYDLILLDWNMPKFTGFDVLCRLRGHGVKSLIAMVTSETNKLSILDAIKAGANSYIMKPFQRDVFTDQIRKLMQTINEL